MPTAHPETQAPLTTSRVTRFLVPNLVWPVAISSAVLLFVGIGGAWYVLRLQRATTDILAWNVTSIRAAEELEISVREIRNQVNRYLLTGDLKQLRDIDKLEPLCEYWLTESSRLARHPEEKQLIDRAREGYSQFQLELDLLQQEPVNDLNRAQVGRLTEEVLNGKVLDSAHQYLDYNERELATSSEHNQIQAERVALSLLLIGICGAAGGLLAGYSLARGILRTIIQISLPIHDVAGQLNEVVGPVSVSGPSKLEDLDQILRTLAVRVSTVIERLRQRERDALRAEQLAAVGQLAAGLAHELRNPLMSMKILVQSAQEEEQGKLAGTDLDVIDDEIVRLEKLVSTFLDFARPANPSKQPINLADILRQTAQLVARQASVRGVQLHSSDLPQELEIEADAAQLRQVFLNLLLNAIDAGRRGGDIWITIENQSRPGMVTIQVADNGQGFPENLKSTLFDPFVSTKPTGIGLGLTICRHLVEAHGGTIMAENQPEGGAVFRLQLPLTQVSTAETMLIH